METAIDYNALLGILFSQNLLFSFFGGLAIFLFGMNYMSDALKNLGSNKFGEILQHLTKSRFRSIMAGTGITCLIQSSSATSVMVVGFVNAGLLSLGQAIAVVLGADIGTTFTAWIVSIMGKFKITTYALPVIFIGFLIFMLAKKKKKKMYGQCLLGFGFLFLGLGTMSSGFDSLKESQDVINMFAQFGKNPLLGVLAGLIVTMVLQSSSATIAIVQVMALNGLVGLDSALALMLGCGIGTTITAHLAAITGTRTARTVAVANSLFKLVGTLIFIPFLYNGWYKELLLWIYPGGNPMTHIAIANSLFNITIVTLFSVALWKPLLKVSEMLSYGKKDGLDRKAKFLDPLFLDEPPIAMQQALNEFIRMSEIAKSCILDAKDAIFKLDDKKIQTLRDKEEILDDLQRQITAYLIKISERDLDTMESKEYPVLLHCVNDMEKIGDYGENLANYADNMISSKLKIPKDGPKNLETMFARLIELCDCVILSLKNKDHVEALKAFPLEDEIDDLKLKCREQYIKRLNKNKNNPELEMVIMDVATNLEKMGDHLTGVAKAVAKDLQWGNVIEHGEEKGDSPAST